MKITGELLKAERLKKNLTVQDVALAIKLSGRIIDAIENGRTDELPAKTFVRGFVKSYAEYLKLDSELILKQFHEEMGSTLPVQKNIEPQQEIPKIHRTITPQNIQENKISNKNVLYFVAIAALVVVIGIINKITNKYQNEIPDQVEATDVKNKPNQAEIAKTLSVSSSVVTTAEEKPLSQANSSEAESANANSSSLPPHDVPESANSTVKNDSHGVPHNQATTSTAVTNSNTTQPSQNLTQTNVEKSKEQPIEVLLEARKDTFISYAKGNTHDFKKVMIKANTYQIIKSSAGLHIKADDGSSINITVNGVNKGLLSTSSKPAEVTY